MKIVEFQVRNFRNIVDSSPISVEPDVTCLVGKNESGKSALLEALYLLRPSYREDYNINEQYPRWLLAQDRRDGNIGERAVVAATFQLEEPEITAIEEELGANIIIDEKVTASRQYNGEIVWEFECDEKAAIRNAIQDMPDALIKCFEKCTDLQEFHDVLFNLQSATNEETEVPSEDIEAAISIIENRGLANQSIQQILEPILTKYLPLIFRFTQYQTLPGRIGFSEIINENPSGGPGATARSLMSRVEADLANLATEDYELRRSEMEAVAIGLTQEVFEYWKQNPDLAVLIDTDKEGDGQKYIDIRLSDKRTGFSNNFSQRSSGFQWFFSFLAAFSEFEEKDQQTIVLLDEPALTLHGRAQADFIRFINERLAPSNTVLYTTHSPFMVEPNALKRVRIVEDKGPPHGSVTSNAVLASDPDSLFPLQAALGYDIAQNLFIGPDNLVVEGISELAYLTAMSSILASIGRTCLDERWRILPAGGAANIPTFVALIGPHLDATVLADSNAKGMQRIEQMIKNDLLSKSRLIFVSDVLSTKNGDIEDLFSTADYLVLYNAALEQDIKSGDLPPGDRIVKRIESTVGKEFDHYRPAQYMTRADHDFSEETLARFEKLFTRINATLSDG